MATSSPISVASSPIYEPDAKSRRYEVSVLDQERRTKMNQIRDEMLDICSDIYMSRRVEQAVQIMRDRLKRNGELTFHGELIFPAHINRAVADLHHKFSLTQICNRSNLTQACVKRSQVGAYKINERAEWQL